MRRLGALDPELEVERGVPFGRPPRCAICASATRGASVISVFPSSIRPGAPRAGHLPANLSALMARESALMAQAAGRVTPRFNPYRGRDDRQNASAGVATPPPRSAVDLLAAPFSAPASLSRTALRAAAKRPAVLDRLAGAGSLATKRSMVRFSEPPILGNPLQTLTLRSAASAARLEGRAGAARRNHDGSGSRWRASLIIASEAVQQSGPLAIVQDGQAHQPAPAKDGAPACRRRAAPLLASSTRL